MQSVLRRLRLQRVNRKLLSLSNFDRIRSLVGCEYGCLVGSIEGVSVVRRDPQVRTPDVPKPEEISLQMVLDALVDPVRRSIVIQLSESSTDLSCGAIDVPVAPSTSTHHFKVLREAGIISQYYVGTSRMNTLRRLEIDNRFPGLLEAYIRAGRTE